MINGRNGIIIIQHVLLPIVQISGSVYLSVGQIVIKSNPSVGFKPGYVGFTKITNMEHRPGIMPMNDLIEPVDLLFHIAYFIIG